MLLKKPDPFLKAHERTRSTSSTTGGVVIGTKKGLQLNKVDSLGRYSTFEYVCGRISSSGTHSIMLLIYRPGSAPPTAEFFEEMDTIILKLVISSDVMMTLT